MTTSNADSAFQPVGINRLLNCELAPQVCDDVVTEQPVTLVVAGVENFTLLCTLI